MEERAIVETGNNTGNNGNIFWRQEPGQKEKEKDPENIYMCI